jgi:hypothetical protein
VATSSARRPLNSFTFGRKSKRDIALERIKADLHYARLSGRDPVIAPEIEVPPPPKKRAKPPGPSEHQIQSAVISWWDKVGAKRYGLPNNLLFAIPNGGARDAITGSRLKAEGVRAGAPDLMLAVPFDGLAGLFIEMKTGTGAVAESQSTFMADLRQQNYETAIARSLDQAIEVIEAYLTEIPF